MSPKVDRMDGSVGPLFSNLSELSLRGAKPSLRVADVILLLGEWWPCSRGEIGPYGGTGGGADMAAGRSSRKEFDRTGITGALSTGGGGAGGAGGGCGLCNPEPASVSGSFVSVAVGASGCASVITAAKAPAARLFKSNPPKLSSPGGSTDILELVYVPPPLSLSLPDRRPPGETALFKEPVSSMRSVSAGDSGSHGKPFTLAWRAMSCCRWLSR